MMCHLIYGLATSLASMASPKVVLMYAGNIAQFVGCHYGQASDHRPACCFCAISVEPICHFAFLSLLARPLIQTFVLRLVTLASVETHLRA